MLASRIRCGHLLLDASASSIILVSHTRWRDGLAAIRDLRARANVPNTWMGPSVPTTFMETAGYVWLLERTTAPRCFLMFGIQRRVSKWRLEKYGGLVAGVEFYFRTDDGTPEQLRCARPMAAIVLRCTRRSVK